MKEIILKVDKNDNIIGEVFRDKAHKGKGILHRAFLVIVFDSKGRILLSKRSKYKKLWHGFWDGSVASHQKKRESLKQSARREIKEEIGTMVDKDKIENLFKFYYRKSFKDVGSEHEICYVLKTVLPPATEIAPNPRETSKIKWRTFKELRKDIKKNPQKYTPWFLIVYKQFFNNVI